MSPHIIADKYTVTETLPPVTGIASYRATGPDGHAVVVSIVDPAGAERFLETMREAGEVDHPHVARVLDWGRLDEGCFVAREDVGGTDLAGLLAGGRDVDARTAADWGAQAAAGLSALHVHGVVHGAISPATLLVAADGSIKVADPCLAVAAGAPRLDAAAPPGAAWYLTPEGIAGTPLTASSDIYALGAVIYRLATGVVPFDGPNAAAVAEAHSLRTPVRPAEIRPTIPPELDMAIMDCLGKTAAERYGSVEELRTQLERVAVDDGAATRVMSSAATTRVMPAVAPGPLMTPPDEKKRKVWPWVVGALVALAVLLIVLWATGVFGGSVDVPNVKDLTVQQATSALDDAHLKVGVITYITATDPTQVAGTVVKQDPAAGTQVDRGSAVDLSVIGSTTVAVPDVRGMTASAAGAAIAKAGLVVGSTVKQYSGSVPSGTVIDQTPQAGTQAPAGSTVVLAVSQGPAPSNSPASVAVPNVANKSEAQAEQTLTAAGFTVTTQLQYSATVPSGKAISTTPAAGVQMAPGSNVVLIVSQGPSPTPTPSPTGT